MVRRSRSIMLGLLAFASVLLMFPRFSYNDPDTFWHLELGRFMIDHKMVLHHAIHTYYGDALPYVPHEFAFQIVLALLYQAFGWPGAYLLTALCLILLILGLDRLAGVSRREVGLEEERPAVLRILTLLVAVWVFYNYFTIRPQMVSAWMIVWYFVHLREFQMNLRWKHAAWMTALSLFIANFHAGVWLVIAVFTAMAAAEAVWERRWTARHAWAYALALLAGLLNPGGLHSILFILTVTKGNFNMLINEWQPIAFSKPETLPMLLVLLFFAAILPIALHRKLFRYLLMLGILYLGVSSYKQNLFMWLLLPYFAASLPEALPMLKRYDAGLRTRWLTVCLAAGIAVNAGIVFADPPKINAAEYPVEEMAYIMERQPAGERPKVMAPYGASGYVMFRGGDVLCDGRQDPFVTDASKGALGWNAFQRSMFGFGEFLPEIVAEDRPQYVIARSGVSWKLLKEWTALYGEPVFQGKFGSVFKIDRD